MRLINADEYEKRIKPYDTEDVIDKALYNFAHDKLVATPTVQQWIPVSERLPEDSEYHLVTEYHMVTIARYWEHRWWDAFGDKAKYVTAWMPLPEPWEGEES